MSSKQKLCDLVPKLLDLHSGFPVKIEDTGKRIRGVFNGQTIFDTLRASLSAKLVWEDKRFPQYWIPFDALQRNIGHFEHDSDTRELWKLSLKKPTTQEEKTIWFLVALIGPLVQYAKFEFKDVDEWFEEQSRILYHPKDPYHRVDILPTSRVIRIEIDGVILADTREEGGVLSLWETSFPGRWYLPRTAVNFSCLTPSTTHTGCPYKGEASYYHINLPSGKKVQDAVWWYPSPLSESTKIEGMLCFYSEKVDTWINGERVPK